MQSDLFDVSREIPIAQSAPKVSFLERTRISLRLDHFVLSMIVMMVFYVFIFSFGVEKGKRFAMAELRAERDKRQYVTEELTKKVFEAREANQTAIQPGKIQPAAIAAIAPTETVTTSSAPSAESTMIIAAQGKYTIQVITYTSGKQAEEKIKLLMEKGRKGFVIPSGKYKQVCVDGFQTKANASEALRQLQSEGLVPRDAYVRPMPQGMI